MNIIVRNPFVSKRRKSLAKIYLDEAESYLAKASEIETREGRSTEDSVKLVRIGCSRMNLAAKAYGFRNLYDMGKYYNKHRKLP